MSKRKSEEQIIALLKRAETGKTRLPYDKE